MEGILVTTTLKMKEEIDLTEDVKPYLTKLTKSTRKEEGNYTISSFVNFNDRKSIFIKSSWISLFYWRVSLQKSYLSAANIKLKPYIDDISFKRWGFVY